MNFNELAIHDFAKMILRHADGLWLEKQRKEIIMKAAEAIVCHVKDIERARLEAGRAFKSS